MCQHFRSTTSQWRKTELVSELQFSCLAIKCLHVSLLVPWLAVPVDVTGSLVYTADSIMLLEYPPIAPSPTTFAEWRDQLPSAEQRLVLRVITFTVYNTEKSTGPISSAWLFRGFVSIDWGHIHMDAEIVPSENIHAYLDQVWKAIKSRPSPDARRASATAYVKTVIQALQDYSLTIWEGRNKVLHGQNHETDLIVHPQLNADIRRIYKLKDAFADSAKQYFHLPLERLLRRPTSFKTSTMASSGQTGCSESQRSWNGTTNALHLLLIHTLISPSLHNFTTNILGYTPIHLQQAKLWPFYLPKLPMIPDEPPWVTDICCLSLPSIWHYLSNYNSAPMRPAALNACIPSQ